MLAKATTMPTLFRTIHLEAAAEHKLGSMCWILNYLLFEMLAYVYLAQKVLYIRGLCPNDVIQLT